MVSAITEDTDQCVGDTNAAYNHGWRLVWRQKLEKRWSYRGSRGIPKGLTFHLVDNNDRQQLKLSTETI